MGKIGFVYILLRVLVFGIFDMLIGYSFLRNLGEFRNIRLV